MMQTILHGDRQATLNTVARHVHSLLDAECCSVLLVPEDFPEELVLEAQYADKLGYDFKSLRLRIHNVPKQGLTGHIAYTGETVSMHGAELVASPYATGKPPEHLASGKCFSLLGMPLKDRKGRLLGLVIVNNKKGLDGKPNETISFTRVDISIARILANKIVIVLENLRTSETLYELMQTMNTVASFQEILNDILRRGVSLFNADRGDFALWDGGIGGLILQATIGESQSEIGGIIPIRSIISTVWNDDDCMLCGDVSSEPSYFEIDSRTRSEIAVRVNLEGRRIGVLNIESFQLDYFDEQDIEVLRLLAQYAAIAVRMIGRETQFRNIVQRLGEFSLPQDFLTSILESLRDIYEFDSGIIYIADDTHRMLRCSAFISGKGLHISDPDRHSYSFKDIALATRVLNKGKGYFCPDPSKDPIVDSRDVRAFQIDSPIVGVPLVFGEKTVGSLVVWSSRAPYPTPEHIDHLKPFARLAAAAIAISEATQQRTVVLEAIQKILSRMQTELSQDKNLRLILQGIQAVGFDRVRVFEFEEDMRRFVGLDSAGMEDPQSFRGHAIYLDHNRYAKHTAETSLPNPVARIYNYTMFGPDPNAAGLGKPLELPWAVVPLVISGELYGQIVADNEHTRREITTDNLSYLTLLGALAAQAIANAETIDMLRASKLKDDFLQRMAHIFGTTTFAVDVLVQNLKDGITDDERVVKDYIPAIARVNERFVGLARNIIDFAALREDTKLNLEKVELISIIKDVMCNLQRRAQEKYVRFDPSFPTERLRWALDPVRVSNAVEALLDNAIKFSPNEATVHIELRATDFEARLTVRDEGPGISDEDRRFVFDDFYRGRNAKESHADGSGLGLSIVAQTMRLHGGEASVENHPNGGAVFTLIFPKTPGANNGQS
jgi:signal transduction histidine kinase/putative methionine-R-sulfoxide reductase with GAF domain